MVAQRGIAVLLRHNKKVITLIYAELIMDWVSEIVADSAGGEQQVGSWRLR